MLLCYGNKWSDSAGIFPQPLRSKLASGQGCWQGSEDLEAPFKPHSSSWASLLEPSGSQAWSKRAFAWTSTSQWVTVLWWDRLKNSGTSTAFSAEKDAFSNVRQSTAGELHSTSTGSGSHSAAVDWAGWKSWSEWLALHPSAVGWWLLALKRIKSEPDTQWNWCFTLCSAWWDPASEPPEGWSP